MPTWTKTGNIRGPVGPQGPTGATGPQGPQGPTGSGILPADTTIALGTRIISNKLVSTDTYPVWQVLGSGQMNFGPGGSSPMDANLYRMAANALKTDGEFHTGNHVYMGEGHAGELIFNVDTAKINFGSAADTNLYRGGAGQLRTDGSLFAGLNTSVGNAWLAVFATGDTQPRIGMLSNGYLNFGPGNATVDTNLYRAAASTLRTDGGMWFGSDVRILSGGLLAYGNVVANYNVAAQWQVYTDGKMYFGSANDTNLYRRGAGVLQTDGSFYANTTSGYLGILQPSDANLRWSVNNNGVLQWSSGSAAADTTLYRYGAAQLATNSELSVASRVMANMGDAATAQVLVGQYGGSTHFAAITLGGDSYLYRAAAKQLQTDGTLGFAGQAAGGTALFTIATGDTNWRFYSTNSGVLNWGPGNAAADTNLYRNGAGLLRTDGQFMAQGAIFGGAQLYLGYSTAGDTYIYRYAGNTVGTIGSFLSSGALTGWGFLAIATGDSYPRTFLRNDAALLFGDGTTSPGDTNIYRAGPGVLGTNSGLTLGNGSLTINNGYALYISVDTATRGWNFVHVGNEANWRHVVDGNGMHQWGAGAAAPDVTLYRYGAGILAVGGSFYATGYLQAAGDLWAYGNLVRITNGPSGGGDIIFNGDTSLYRLVANRLRTDGSFDVMNTLRVGVDNTSKIFFGSADDTNFYRSSAGVLATDGDFIVRPNQSAQVRLADNGSGCSTIWFGAGSVDYLYHPAVNNLTSNSSLYAQAFNVVSDRAIKREIEIAEPLHEELLAANVYTYHRDNTDRRHMGLMADELPESIRDLSYLPDGNTISYVDVYKLCAALVQTVQHLNERIIELEGANV